MKIEGSYTVQAPRDAVWQRLMDPASLARALPGCEKLEPNADGSYTAQLNVGVAAIRGNYTGRIEILDAVRPEQYRLKISGKGTGGFLNGEGLIMLAETGPGTTEVRYSGDAQVGGLIASVGQRLMQAAARQIVGEFFQALGREVQSQGG